MRSMSEGFGFED